jgi:hypothetical protein
MIDFGYIAGERRTSIWYLDAALANITPAAFAEWLENPEAGILEPFATNGPPTLITWRSLTGDERRFVEGLAHNAVSGRSASERIYRACFRLAVSIEGLRDTWPDPKGSGKEFPSLVRENGFVMLSNGVVDYFAARYPTDRKRPDDRPGMVDFYGMHVYAASTLSEIEKKASSLPSTLMPSSAAEAKTPSTEGTTEQPPKPQGA